MRVKYIIKNIRTSEELVYDLESDKEFLKVLNKRFMGFKRTSNFAHRRDDMLVWGMVFIKKKDFTKSKREPVDFYEVLCDKMVGCI
ncbi:Uncharacterised protein [Acinetobacter phage MD-2021a]|nr:Uncharacterised protein [Acinetobacter phage MD-2021a]CAH1088649.1 Uncharacterised protein [Acinetobacter phage MD-2021a]